MIVSSGLMLMPADLVLDAEQDSALSDDDLSGSRSTSTAHAEFENASASDADMIASDLAPSTKSQTAASFATAARGVIKPLVSLVTAQYVIVTALVAMTAVTVIHHASHAINEKFAAILTALKRF